MMRLPCSSISVALFLLEPLASTSCVHLRLTATWIGFICLVVSPVWFNSYGSTWTVQLVRPSQPCHYPLGLALCPCSLVGRACAPTHSSLPPSCRRVSVFGRCERTVFRLPPLRGATDTAGPGRRNVTAWGRARRGWPGAQWGRARRPRRRLSSHRALVLGGALPLQYVRLLVFSLDPGRGLSCPRWRCLCCTLPVTHSVSECRRRCPSAAFRVGLGCQRCCGTFRRKAKRQRGPLLGLGAKRRIKMS